MNFLRKLFSFRDKRHSRTAPGGDDAHDDDVVKPFLEHLEDLRKTLFKMAWCIVIGMIVAFYFHDELFRLIKAPLIPLKIQLINIDLISPFMMSMKLAFYAGIVFSFPFLLYFAAEFVMPALTRKERKLLIPAVLIGFLLFACGVLIAYLFLLPRTLEWLQQYALKMGVDAYQVEVAKHFSLSTNLCLACGFLCEVPIVVLGLALMGIVSHELLTRTRAYAMTAIMILVAVIAPTPDPVMFITLAIPVLLIYEACIWIVWLIERKRK